VDDTNDRAELPRRKLLGGPVAPLQLSSTVVTSIYDDIPQRPERTSFDGHALIPQR
jgi:hypothetical protein